MANRLANGSMTDNTNHSEHQAAPLRVLDYDESQMLENDGERREQRASLVYEC